MTKAQRFAKIRALVIFSFIGFVTLPVTVFGVVVGYLVPRLVFEDSLFLPLLLVLGILYAKGQSKLLYDYTSHKVFESTGFELPKQLEVVRLLVCFEGVGIAGVLGAFSGSYLFHEDFLNVYPLAVIVGLIVISQLSVLFLIFSKFRNSFIWAHVK